MKAPARVRTDCGSENIFIAASQCFLRRDGLDEYAGEKAHVYGSSHHNQRIEAWWSQLRRMKTEFMITFFRKMFAKGELNADNDLQKACMQYCFGDFVQAELDDCREAWNSHYIRKSNRSQCHGRPDALYHLPNEHFPDQSVELYGKDLQVMQDHLNEYNERFYEEDVFFEYFEYVTEELHLEKPTDLEMAKHNYLAILAQA